MREKSPQQRDLQSPSSSQSSETCSQPPGGSYKAFDIQAIYTHTKVHTYRIHTQLHRGNESKYKSSRRSWNANSFNGMFSDITCRSYDFCITYAITMHIHKHTLVVYERYRYRYRYRGS